MRQHADRHIGVDVLQLAQDCFQNCLVSGVSLAVGAADHDAAAFFLRTRRLSENGPVNIQLVPDRRFSRINLLCLFIEVLAELSPERGVLDEPYHIACQRLDVARRKQKSRHAGLHHIGNAADAGRNRRAAHPRALNQRIRRAFGKRRQHVDVDGMVKAVRVLHPTGKHDASRRAGFLCQAFQHLPLLAVSRDNKADIGALSARTGKAANQRRNVLDGVQTRGNAENDGVFIIAYAEAFEVFSARKARLFRRKRHAVVNRKQLLRIKASGNEQLDHRVGHADVIVEHAQADGVDRAVGKAVERTPQIVEPIVRVDSRDNRNVDRPLQNRTDHIRARAVAVDNIKAFFLNHALERADAASDAAIQHQRIDAHRLCVVCERARREAHEAHGLRSAESFQQRQHMRLCPADVAAGNQMDNLHKNLSNRNWLLFLLLFWDKISGAPVFSGTQAVLL